MKYFLLTLLLISGVTRADNSSLNLSIPTSPQNFQSDSFRAGDLDCRNAIGSSTNVEFGVVGVLSQNDPWGTNNIYGDPSQRFNDDLMKDVGVYAKITIPIGAPKERINCNALYKLELERRELEVQKLRAELQQLKNLKFED